MQPTKREEHVPHESEKPLPANKSGDARHRGTTHPGVADADKRARTGSSDERTRDTPPAGKWNDIASNE
jgi:hypothetical protein